MTWHVAVYEALLHSAVAGCVLLAVASAALVAIRQPARRIRAIELALAALVALPLVPLVPGYPRVDIWPAASAPLAVEQKAPLPVINRPIADVPAAPSSPLTVENDAPTIAPPLVRQKASVAPPAAAKPIWRLPRDYRFWIVIAYLGGVGAMIVWSLVGLAAAARLLWSARAADDACRAVFREIAGPAHERVALVVSRRASQPCAILWRRPTIVLPEDLTKGTNSRPLRFALAHEWSHAARGDVWSWGLSTAVRWFYFYQPLVWHLRRELRLCQDYLADAAGAADAAEDYAEFLTSYSSHLAHPNLAPGLGIAGRRSELHRRIVMLLEHRPALERAAPRRWNLVVAPIAVLLVAAAACVRAESGPPPAKKPAAQVDRSSDVAPFSGRTPRQFEPGNVPDALVDREVENDPIVRDLTEKMIALRIELTDPHSPEEEAALERKFLRLEEMIDERKGELRPRVLELLGARGGQQGQAKHAVAVPPFSGRIRPGDILGIQLVGGFPGGGPDKATVEPEGTLPLGPLYGRIHVAGKTLPEAQQALEAMLREILADPTVQLTYIGHDSGVVASDAPAAPAAPPPRSEAPKPPTEVVPPRSEAPRSPYVPAPPPLAKPLREEPLTPLDTVEILIPLKPQVHQEVLDGKTVEVFSGRMPNFNGTYVIEPSGEISLGPRFGRVDVKGMDTRQAGRAIRDRLSESMLTRTALPTVHVLKRGRAVFPEGKEPPADYRVRPGDGLLVGQWYVDSPNHSDLFNYVVDADGNLGEGDRKVKVAGMRLAEVEAALRKSWEGQSPGQEEEVEVPWYVTIGGWREEADPEVIDRIEGSDQTRIQRLERELQEIKQLIRAQKP